MLLHEYRGCRQQNDATTDDRDPEALEKSRCFLWHHIHATHIIHALHRLVHHEVHRLLGGMDLSVHILVADDDLDRAVIHGRGRTRDHRIDRTRLTRLDIADVAAGVVDRICLKLRGHVVKDDLTGVVDVEHHVRFTADVNAFRHHIVVGNRKSCLLVNRDIQRHLLLGILEIRGVILFIDGQCIGTRINTRFRHHIPGDFLRLTGCEAVDDIGIRAVLRRQCRGLIHLFRLEGKQDVAGADAGTCVLHLHHQLKRLSGIHLLRFGMIARYDETCL